MNHIPIDMKLRKFLKKIGSYLGNERGSWGMIAAAVIVGGAGVGVAAMAGSAQEKAQEKAIAAGKEQTQAQLQATREAEARAAMTPEEKAYQSMMMKRAEAGLTDIQAPDITESYMPKALESLQKYYMQRGWQPSPAQTGLLIEPSQQVAKDVALQNALLRQSAQQQAWANAQALYPQQQRAIEQGAPLSTLPYTTQAYTSTTAAQQLAAQQQYEQSLAMQKAMGSLLMSYSSPLLQQRITSGSQITGGVGGQIGYSPQFGQTWSPSTSQLRSMGY